MRTSATITAFAIAFPFLVIAGMRGASSTAIEPRNTRESLAVTEAFADDLAKLCGCVERFGPPAPTLDPTVLPIDVSLEDNTKCKGGSACPSPNGCCQPC